MIDLGGEVLGLFKLWPGSALYMGVGSFDQAWVKASEHAKIAFAVAYPEVEGEV